MTPPAWHDVKWSSLVDLLRSRAEDAGEQVVFTFVAEGEREEESLTYSQLDRRARSIAAWLQAHDLGSARVLLLYPPGLEFVCGLVGCLYAGAVAVPGYPPSARRTDPRMDAIKRDARATVVFSVASARRRITEQFAGPDVQIAFTDETPDLSSDWQATTPARGDLAWLQYTSGSTTDPKGVMVTHANALHSGWYLTGVSRLRPGLSQVTWLPFFHDFGLIAGVVLTLYSGCRTYVLPPAAFVQRPIRLLRTIERYRSGMTIGPNFMFDACVDETSREDRRELDLRCLTRAWNAAEPVRADTLKRFAETYAPFGLDPDTIKPAYGLAEATLCVAVCASDEWPRTLTCRSDALQRNVVEPCAPDDPQATTLVGSGRVGGEMTVEIVHPETLSRCTSDEVGEIWISGPGVTQGYWDKPALTKETFGARLNTPDEAAGRIPYLRSGDLGFCRDGELYVLGRLKDLMIIRGRNVYPQDVEHAIETSHPALRSNASAAFAVEAGGPEEVVVVVEMKRAGRAAADLDEIFQRIIRTSIEQFELRPHRIVVVKPYGTPKTSSGKIMRRACRARLLAGELDIVGEWHAPTDRKRAAEPALAPVPLERLRAASPAARRRMILERVLAVVAQVQGMETAPDPRAGFVELGIDSARATRITGILSDAFGAECDLPATLLFDHADSDAVARYIESLLVPEERPTAPRPTKRGRATTDAIAIVGMSCRFPGAPNIDAFWEMLEHGRDAVGEVPLTRGWHPFVAAERAANYAALLDDIDRFDADFFGISPREAESLDPQQRLLLEQAICALEDGCFAPASLMNSRTGVFVGISTNDYLDVLKAAGSARLAAYLGTGTSHSAAAGRLAYVLGLKGPCMAVDTACSASLVAVHLASDSLRRGECDIAISAGVNAILTPTLSQVFAQAKMLSPAGRCRTFDAAADGYVRGEGCAVVVLKRLGDAERDRDRIISVIRGSAVNQNGRTSGLTVPSGSSQQLLIADALAKSGVAGSDISYLEAHGTATSLGDPIEVIAAAAVLGPGRTAGQPLFIGSVKTNIGHLESAAGIAGVVKASLALERGSIPPHLGFEIPNPHIPWSDLPLRVPTQSTPWPPAGRRLAAVSSFGFSGTNAHAILEQAPLNCMRTPRRRAAERGAYLLAVSARAEAALSTLAAQYGHWIDAHPDVNLSDFCFSVNTGRDHHEHRGAIVFTDRSQLIAQLQALATRRDIEGVSRGSSPRARTRPRVALVLRGRTPVANTRASALYEIEPVFRDAIDRCASASHDATHTEVAGLYQPQAALAELWRSWGVDPDVIIVDVSEQNFGSARQAIRACATGTGPMIENASCRDFDFAVELDDVTPEQLMRKAAGLYAQGIGLDFAAMEHPWSATRSKLSLPTYPFQRERFWADALPAADAPTVAAGNAQSLYVIGWERQAPAAADRERADRQHWLIVSDHGGYANRLAERLRDANAVSVQVLSGTSLVTPSEAQRVIEAAVRTGANGLHAVHMCSLDAQAHHDVWSAQEVGSLSALHLVQALTRLGTAAQLTIVTRQSQRIGESAAQVRPEHGPLWALGNTIAAEHPEMRCRRIDIDSDVDEALLDREISHADEVETEVGLRSGDRYVSRLIRVDVPRGDTHRPVRGDGTYLVTGGFGGVGRKVGDWLSEQGAGTIAIVSRQGLDAIGASAAIDAWKARGSEVLVYKADVSNMQDMSEVWQQLRRRATPLRGIIHAAGVIDDGVLFQQTRERFTQAMRPKILGAWNLHRLSQTDSSAPALDFFVCYSSLASVLGARGQGNYVAANGFLDSLAHYRRQLGLPALTINWGPWSSVGMAAMKPLRIAGLHSLTTRHGLELFEQALRLHDPQVLAADVDWNELSRTFHAGRPVALLTHLCQHTASGDGWLRQRLEGIPVFERMPALTSHVRKVVAAVLGHPVESAIDIHQGLFDAGMDSLMAVELRNRLSADSGILLPPTLVFRNPSVSQLAAQLVEMIGLDVPVSPRAGANPRVGADALVETVRGLSDEEAALLIHAEGKDL